MRVGIIAATKIDTKFGVDLVRSNGHESMEISISNSPREQNQLQVLNKRELTLKVMEAIKKFEDFDRIIIYCNSLSGAIEMDYTRKNSNIKIVTPLDIHRKIANNNNNFGVMAANGLSVAQTEKVLLENNKNAKVIGFANLSMVEEFEKDKA